MRIIARNQHKVVEVRDIDLDDIVRILVKGNHIWVMAGEELPDDDDGGMEAEREPAPDIPAVRPFPVVPVCPADCLQN